MATSLYFSDGTTTFFDCNSSTQKLVNGFAPAVMVSRRSQDNDQLTESFKVILLGTSAADISTRLANLDNVTQYVERRQDEPSLPKLYLYFAIDGAAGAFRAELTEVSYTLEKSLGDWWPTRDVMVTIRAVRKNFWEDATERQIPLTNANGTNNTAGLTIYPWDDSQTGKDNWVSMVGTDILGSIPTPAKIAITNSYNDANRTNKILVGHNVYATPGTFNPVLEAESASGIGAWTQSALNYSTNSNGYILSASIPAGATYNMYWTFTSAQLVAAAGRMFRVILRTQDTNTLWVRVTLTIAGLNLLYDGPWVLLQNTSNYISEIDTIQLPPYLVGVATLYDVRLTLYVKNTSTGAMGANIDYLHLVPADSFRVYISNGFQLGYNATLWDDPIQGYLYSDWGASGAVGNYVAYGDPVMLVPGKNQRLHFQITGPLTNIGLRTSTVRVWHRPRKRSL